MAHTRNVKSNQETSEVSEVLAPIRSNVRNTFDCDANDVLWKFNSF